MENTVTIICHGTEFEVSENELKFMGKTLTELLDAQMEDDAKETLSVDNQDVRAKDFKHMIEFAKLVVKHGEPAVIRPIESASLDVWFKDFKAFHPFVKKMA